MRDSYNPEGYHCLIIAILMGVNAREARFLYEHGLNNPISQKILKRSIQNCAGVNKKGEKRSYTATEKRGLQYRGYRRYFKL